MNVFTRNQHGGCGLRSFQEVHVRPLEGLTVVGLQVTGHENKEIHLLIVDTVHEDVFSCLETFLFMTPLCYFSL